MPDHKNRPPASPVETEPPSKESRVQEKLRRITEYREKIFKENFTIDVLGPNEMTPEQIREISDFFRFMFNNAWGEFVVCTQCDPVQEGGMQRSAMDVFGTGEDYVSVEQMDGLTSLPDCPCCTKPMELFHDPEATFQKMQGKLASDGYASILREKAASDRISGFTFGYGSTVEGVFEGEWKNRYNYLKEPPPEHDRQLQALIDRLNDAAPDTPFSADTPVFGWNCIATAPWVRSVGSLHGIMTSFFDSIPDHHMGQHVIGESQIGSTANRMFKRGGVTDVPGFLEGKNIVGVTNLRTFSQKLTHR